MVVVVNISLQLELAVLLIALVGKFYIMFHNQKYLSHKKNRICRCARSI